MKKLFVAPMVFDNLKKGLESGFTKDDTMAPEELPMKDEVFEVFNPDRDGFIIVKVVNEPERRKSRDYDIIIRPISN